MDTVALLLGVFFVLIFGISGWLLAAMAISKMIDPDYFLENKFMRAVKIIFCLLASGYSFFIMGLIVYSADNCQ